MVVRFGATVVPMFSYGCEIQVYENILTVIASVNVEFLKYVLNFKSSKPLYTKYRETDNFLLNINLYTSLSSYLVKLLITKSWFNSVSSIFCPYLFFIAYIVYFFYLNFISCFPVIHTSDLLFLFCMTSCMTVWTLLNWNWLILYRHVNDTDIYTGNIIVPSAWKSR